MDQINWTELEIGGEIHLEVEKYTEKSQIYSRNIGVVTMESRNRCRTESTRTELSLPWGFRFCLHPSTIKSMFNCVIII